MTKEQIQNALRIYRDKVVARVGRFLKPCKAPTIPGDHGHLLWMIDEIDKMLAQPGVDMEKVMRWVGFLQGALWCNQVCTIDEMRDHCRSVPVREFAHNLVVALVKSDQPEQQDLEPEPYECVGCGGQCPVGHCGRGM